MSSAIIAGVAVFVIMIMYMVWASQGAPKLIGETPSGTPIYAADAPAAGIVVPAGRAAGGAMSAGMNSAQSVTSTGPAKDGASPTYTFHQGYGTDGDNLQVDTNMGGKIDELKKACNALAGCVGFTTFGALKSNVERSKWVERTKEGPAFGLYVRD